jgi:acyl-CoA synthetase (AMP-forming)/AMP-acid ligase II
MPPEMSLIESLQRVADRVILRVVESAGTRTVHEFTGRDLLNSAAIARRQPIAENSRVVLLLLPHSPELFLLQIGLVLCGKVPAVLPWPTTRVDGVKYQRNLLHQLNYLPADHLITLPDLARNLQPGLVFAVSGFELANGKQFGTMFMERFIPEVGQPSVAVAQYPLPEDALLLQFSGGTTGTQKRVAVTAAMLAEQIDRLAEAL